MATSIKKSHSAVSSITFHYHGSIAVDHNLTIRTLGKTLDHFQNAIDRSYLDLKYGNVIKHQRLKKSEYIETDFIALPPRDGGYIMEMISASGKRIADRLSAAIERAYDADLELSEHEHAKLLDQARTRTAMYGKTKSASHFSDFVENKGADLARAYGDRSIVKEIDQILSLIRTEQYADSTLEISTYGTRANPVFTFDHKKAKDFHEIVSERRIGDPVIVPIELRSLDLGRENQISHGKAKNLVSGKDFSFLVPSPSIFEKLTPHLRKRRKDTVNVVACPIYEYHAFDPNAGDMVIIAIAD